MSPGCERCYAETFSRRVGLKVWGQQAERRFFGDKHWAEPVKWNCDAQAAGLRRRVFCASMADVFEDRRDLESPRSRLWQLIERTPRLDWLLLTKRPENHSMVPLAWQTGSRRPLNLWFGCTAENQECADRRIPLLLEARWPAVRFISAEPLLGPIDLRQQWERALVEEGVEVEPRATYAELVDWVITGFESGHHARPTDEDWVRSLRDQCQEAGTAFFYKQKVVGRLKVGTPELDGKPWTEFPAGGRR